MSNLSFNRRSVLGAAVALPIVAAVGAPTQAKANELDVLRVSSLGYDPVNSTSFLQAALNSTATTVIIDRVAGNWITDPLTITRSNFTLIIEPGVTVEARPGGFTGLQDRLLQLTSCSNVTISGYGATLKMQKAQYTTGEWRNTMRLYAVSNVTVEGLTLRDSGGDGIGMTGTNTMPSQNIVLRDLVCNNNKRNGLTVGSVDGLLVEGCAFINTSGTPPQAGIDIEPDSPGQIINNVVLRNCYVVNNVTCAIQVALAQLSSTSTPVDVRIERTTIGSRVGGSPQIMVRNADGAASPVPGLFEMYECLIPVGTYAGALGTFAMAASGTMTKLNRTTIWDWDSTYGSYETITFKATGATTYGNLAFSQAVIASNQTQRFMRAYNNLSTLSNVTGDVTVINPNGVTWELTSNVSNVTVAVTGLTSEANATVTVTPLTTSVTGGQPAQFRLQRTGGNLAKPLTVAYQTTGTAIERYDYQGLGKTATFAPNVSTLDLSVGTYPRRWPTDPASRALTLTIGSGRRYVVSGTSATATITN